MALLSCGAIHENTDFKPNQKCTTSMLTWQLQSSLAKENSQQ